MDPKSGMSSEQVKLQVQAVSTLRFLRPVPVCFGMPWASLTCLRSNKRYQSCGKVLCPGRHTLQPKIILNLQLLNYIMKTFDRIVLCPFSTTNFHGQSRSCSWRGGFREQSEHCTLMFVCITTAPREQQNSKNGKCQNLHYVLDYLLLWHSAVAFGFGDKMRRVTAENPELWSAAVQWKISL